MDLPMLRNRCSPDEWSGSEIVNSNWSPNTVVASEKLMPCFFSFVVALFRSHSNSTTHISSEKLNSLIPCTIHYLRCWQLRPVCRPFPHTKARCTPPLAQGKYGVSETLIRLRRARVMGWFRLWRNFFWQLLDGSVAEEE